jgi:uncharacterized membrane protein
MEPTSKKSNGFGITALVLGIVAFCLGWTGILGLIVAVLALIFGVLALVKKQSKGMGITGIVLGLIALITALIFTLIGVAIFGGAAHVANEAHKEQQAIDSAKKDFAKGEAATFGKLTVKVNQFTPGWTSGNSYITAKDGYEYAFVNVNVKNTSSEDVSLNPIDFKMNDNGVLDVYDITPTPTPLSAVVLKPGSSVDGDILFQVKSGATGLKLVYTTYDIQALKEVSYTLGL